MKQQLIGLLGFVLLLFCILVVIWQVFMGTRKYLAAPVANKISAEEVELPVITICHINKTLRIDDQIYGLDYDDLKKGRFYPEERDNVSAEEMVKQALDEHYYLLDATGELFLCHLSFLI